MWKHWRTCIFSIVVASTAGATAARADGITVTLQEATEEGVGAEIGTVRLADSKYGLLIEPELHGLTPGPHGAHVHENPDCGPVEHEGKVIAAGAAGGHYDPQNTGRSEGPYGDGTLGDLPNLIAEQDGTVTIPTLAPRLKVSDIHGRALVIHAGAGRYGEDHASHQHADASARRVACGVIK